MKRTSLIRLSLLFVSVATLAFAGCSKKSDTANTPADQQATNNSTNNVGNAISQAMGGAAAHKSAAHAIPSSTLAGFLPNLSGFTAQEPETSSMTMSGVEWSTADREFNNGDKHVKVTLADYNYLQGLTAAYSMMENFSMENAEELQHGEKFGGYPGWVDWKKKANEGQVGVVLGDRIYLMVEGSGGVTLDDLRAIVNGMNLDGIAKAAS